MRVKTDRFTGARETNRRSGVLGRGVRAATAALLLYIGSAATGASPAGAVEIVPSYGLTRASDGDQTRSNLGLALRSGLAGPMLQSEIGVSYRSEQYYDGDLDVKKIPVTASLLVRPVPMLHADAGIGLYITKYDYTTAALQGSDETKEQFGVHLGGGIQMPLAPMMALDLTGRYVFMQSQESELVPTTFDPDFWSLSLGLALKL